MTNTIPTMTPKETTCTVHNPQQFLKVSLWALLLLFCTNPGTIDGAEPDQPLRAFFSQYCYDCHKEGRTKGGLDLTKLDFDLAKPATFSKWVRIFDRIDHGEMPPASREEPKKADREKFLQVLGETLTKIHAKSKGTVLRRLNRREYERTLNDVFGTNLDLEGRLPEDGRSHEFDNVGAALGLSRVHLQQYVNAMDLVLDNSIALYDKPPKPNTITASYADTREAERFLGRVWKKLPDGAVVQFSSGGYPSGMLRGSGVREPGFYRVRITGYAYQSKAPITFFVGGTSFARGSEKPVYGFWSFPLGKPSTVEFTTWIESRYMLQIEPYGVADPDRYKRKSIDGYKGPGLAVKTVTLEGPLVGEYPSNGHRMIFDGITRKEIPPRNPRDRFRRGYKPKFTIETKDEIADVTKSLHRVAKVAFRRPVKDEDIDPYVQLFQTERKAGASIEDALRTAVIGIFCSPRFLYLREPAGKLDDYALATRLSYFLTRTTPDEELLKVAASGKLAKDESTLRQQTERLLNDPRFERFLVDFTDAWLNLRDMDFTIPDRSLFPEYDNYLRYSMPLETRAFLNELIKSNLSTTNLVKSDFAMLNSRLSEHYNLPAVDGAEIRKVKLPKDSIRGGFLTQASILKVTANGTNSSPVTRGVWVMERILGETPQPPPPGIPGVEPDIRGASTLRELLKKHRNLQSCASCHQRIDPPGFALESFNPIGGYRERYRSLGTGERVNDLVQGRRVRYRLGPVVDSSGKLPDDREFANFKEFRELLANQPEMVTKTLTEKLLTFGTGRELGFSDRKEVNRIVSASKAKGYGVRDLIHLIVQSETFLNK